SPFDALRPSGRPAGESPVGAEGGLETLTIALLITAIIAVVAVRVVIAWRRQTAPPEAAAGQARHATTEAVDVGLDALRSEPDPRRAVIAAYAAMGRSLSRS